MPTSGIPAAPTSLTLRLFTPARTDSPLNLSYFTFTDTVTNKCHRAVCYRDNTYIGWVDNRGVVGVTKVNNITKESTYFDLEDVSTYITQLGGAEIDDHDNAAVFIRFDGRITCYYTVHNDPSGIRSRTTIYPEDITQWSPAIVDTPVNKGSSPNVNLPTCYSNPRLLEDTGILLNHFRTGTPPKAPHAILFANIQNTQNSTASDSDALPLIESTLDSWKNQRPYVKSVVNGKNRVDFFFTDGHPGDSGTRENGNGTSLYHFTLAS